MAIIVSIKKSARTHTIVDFFSPGKNKRQNENPPANNTKTNRIYKLTCKIKNKQKSDKRRWNMFPWWFTTTTITTTTNTNTIYPRGICIYSFSSQQVFTQKKALNQQQKYTVHKRLSFIFVITLKRKKTVI